MCSRFQLTVLICVFAVVAHAEVPNHINFQGTLKDSIGNPVNGTASITFTFFTLPEMGFELWSETHPAVEISSGLFQVILGTLHPLPDTLLTDPGIWLEIHVGEELLHPRIQAVSVPFGLKCGSAEFAVQSMFTGHAELSMFADSAGFAGFAAFAEHANHATYSDTAEFAVVGAPDNDWIIDAENVCHVLGNVGIGTIGPQYKLDVTGDRIRLQDSTETKQISLRVDGPQTGILADNANLVLRSTTGNTIIQGVGGNVGIGTITPISTLDVVGNRIRLGDSTGTRSKEIELRVDGAEADIEATGADLFIKSNGGNTILQGFGGNVGIGTNSPEAPLHVSNSSSSFGMFRIERSDSGDHEASMAFIEGSDATGGDFWLQGVGLWGHINDFVIGRSSTKFLITPWGNIGIGTSNPQELLHVYGTNNPRMIVEAPSSATPELNLKRGTENWQLFMSSDDDLAFFKDGTKVTFTDYGYVGIGTTSPQELLHVYGTSNPRIVIGAPSSASPEINLQRGAEAYQIFMNSDNDLVFFNDGTRAILTETGDMGIGTYSPDEKLHVVGTVKCTELKITGGSDIAEPFDVKEEEIIQPGMVMSIDPDNPGRLKVAETAYDHCVAGIISGAGGISPGMIMGQSGSMADGEYPIAMTGRVYCQADVSGGSILPGDLLTTSDTPGHAMKVTDYTKAHGATIGKAMTCLEKGTGLVLVLVALQ